MNQQLFRGTGVALVTPFKDGKVDYEALEDVIEHVIKGGVDFLVSLGTTGEAVTLSPKESRGVLDFTIQVNAGRKPVVAGCFGSNNTANLLSSVQAFNFEGVDVIMSASPSYSKPTQEGIFQHYMALGEVSPLPILIYNVPGRTASNITAETLLRLAESGGPFLGVKEASGNMVQGQELLKYRPNDFLVLSGDDPTVLPLLGCGADGGVSVVANALPALFSDMIQAALENNWSHARQLNNQMIDIHPLLYVEGNPAGIKGAMEVLGLCSREVRLPLVPLSQKRLGALSLEIEKIRVNP